jgi:hypothetical protein
MKDFSLLIQLLKFYTLSTVGELITTDCVLKGQLYKVMWYKTLISSQCWRVILNLYVTDTKTDNRISFHKVMCRQFVNVDVHIVLFFQNGRILQLITTQK